VALQKPCCRLAGAAGRRWRSRAGRRRLATSCQRQSPRHSHSHPCCGLLSRSVWCCRTGEQAGSLRFGQGSGPHRDASVCTKQGLGCQNALEGAIFEAGGQGGPWQACAPKPRLCRGCKVEVGPLVPLVLNELVQYVMELRRRANEGPRQEGSAASVQVLSRSTAAGGSLGSFPLSNTSSKAAIRSC
jgi:hypothetical protein